MTTTVLRTIHGPLLAEINEDGSFSLYARAVGANIVPARVTIANGASESDAVDCDGKMIAFIEMPAAWTTAALSMKHSQDGTNYFSVYDRYLTEWSLPSTTSIALKTVVFDPPLAGRKSVKLRSGLSGAAVNQGADRVFTVGLVP